MDHHGEVTELPTDFSSHVRLMLPALPELPRSVAQLLVDKPAECAQLSLRELAEHADTSEATVARTARLLGYSGLRQLRLALVADAARLDRTPAPSGMLGAVSTEDDLSTVVAKLTRDERESLADTGNALDVSTLSAAVEAIGQARRVDLYGLMASGLVAQDLAQKLLRVGIAAQAHTEAHIAVTSSLQLGENDVAIGISHSGDTTEVLEPLQHAANAGATSIAITGNARSAISTVAEHVLFAAEGRETELQPAALASRASQLLVSDCVFVGVAARRPGSMRALRVSLDALAPKHQIRPR